MSIFERFKGKKETSNTGGEWEEVAALANERRKSPEDIKREKLERKIVAALYSGDLSVLGQDDSSIIKENAEKEIAEEMMTGGIDIEKRGREVLGEFSTAVATSGEETVYKQLGNDLHQKSVVGYMAGMDWAERGSTGPNDVKKVVEKYPTIMDFNDNTKRFLDGIERDNDVEKREQYEKAVRSVGVKLYGYEQSVAALEIDNIKKIVEAEERVEE